MRSHKNIHFFTRTFQGKNALKWGLIDQDSKLHEVVKDHALLGHIKTHVHQANRGYLHALQLISYNSAHISVIDVTMSLIQTIVPWINKDSLIARNAVNRLHYESQKLRTKYHCLSQLHIISNIAPRSITAVLSKPSIFFLTAQL